MNQRTAQITRQTAETAITLSLNLDGTGQGEIHTGIGFFDHLLEALRKHSLIDLTITAQGDLHVDGHHTVEDVGICLGQAFRQALGSRMGIVRFGFAYCPLDEALCRTVVDISGRGFLALEGKLNGLVVSQFDGEWLTEFLRSFATQASITMHISVLQGENKHHIMESLIKSMARALRMAMAVDERESGLPTTKGFLQ
jgi:imidazoleglycerol-phosphate dehydratase